MWESATFEWEGLAKTRTAIEDLVFWAIVLSTQAEIDHLT